MFLACLCLVMAVAIYLHRHRFSNSTSSLMYQSHNHCESVLHESSNNQKNRGVKLGRREKLQQSFGFQADIHSMLLERNTLSKEPMKAAKKTEGDDEGLLNPKQKFRQMNRSRSPLLAAEHDLLSAEFYSTESHTRKQTLNMDINIISYRKESRETQTNMRKRYYCPRLEEILSEWSWTEESVFKLEISRPLYMSNLVTVIMLGPKSLNELNFHKKRPLQSIEAHHDTYNIFLVLHQTF